MLDFTQWLRNKLVFLKPPESFSLISAFYSLLTRDDPDDFHEGFTRIPILNLKSVQISNLLLLQNANQVLPTAI